MASPTPGDKYVKPLLTNAGVKWLQDNSNFIANQVFPDLRVRRQSGHIAQYSIADFYRNPGKQARRAMYTESQGTKYSVDMQEYMVYPYSLHKDIAPEEVANEMDPFDADRDASELVTQQLVLQREVEFAENFFKPGVWDNDLTGADTGAGLGEDGFLQWDQTGSDPIQDISRMRVKIGRTGHVPNVLAVDFETHEALKNNEAILDRIKFGGSSRDPAVVTNRALAELFEVDKYVVARAVFTTSPDGDVDETTDYIMQRGALLAHATPTPTVRRPSAGYTIVWPGLFRADKTTGLRMKKWWRQDFNSWRVEGDMTYGLKTVAPSLAAFFDKTVGDD